jgi:tetratricopeptide (TPR) repeat protein
MQLMKSVFARVLMLVVAAGLLSACGGKEERKAKYLERGKTFLAEKNYEKATLEFKNVLQIDPKSAEAFLHLGEIDEKKQNWPRSFANYQKASELDPELTAPRAKLARFYLAQASALKGQEGQLEAAANSLGLAQEQVTEILSREPDNLDGLALQAMLWESDGDVDKAAAQLERVLAADPGHESAAMLLANIYIQDDRTSDAERVLLSAAGNNAEPVALQRRLAQFYATLGQNDKAEEVLRKIISDNPGELSHRVSLVSFLSQTEQLDKAEKALRDAIAADPSEAQRYLLLTEFLSMKRGPEAAIGELKLLIAQKPEMWELQLALVRIYVDNAQKSDAKATLEQIIRTHGVEPAGIRARIGLAMLLAAEDPDAERVSSLLTEVLRENPRDNDALLLRGKLAARKGQYAEAIADFRSVLKDQPNSPEVLQLLASVHASNNEMELARDTLMRGIEAKPEDSGLRLALARLLAQSGDYDDALRQVESVLSVNAYHEQALAMKYDLLSRKGDAAGMEAVARLMQAGAPEKEEGYIREARLRIAEKDYDAALVIVDRILEQSPDSVPALLAKSDALVSQGKLDAAIPVTEKLQSVAPKRGVGYFRKGKLLERKGEMDAALAQYAKGLDVAPESAELLAAFVNLEVQQHGPEKAEERLRKMLAENPNHRLANEYLGVIYVSQRAFADAERAFAAQIATNPQGDLVYAQLAEVRLAQDNVEGAVEAYKQGLDVMPKSVRLLIGLAGVEERRRDIDAAIALYEQVLEIQPDNAVSVNNLAALLSDHRTDPESLAKAAELAAVLENTNQPAFIDTAGWVYYRKADYDKAIEVLQGAVEKAPDVPVFRYHLGMAYFKKGDQKSAKEHLQKAIEGDPGYAGVEEARSVLATL